MENYVNRISNYTGLNLKHVANVLNLSEHTVKAQIKIALKKIRAEIDKSSIM